MQARSGQLQRAARPEQVLAVDSRVANNDGKRAHGNHACGGHGRYGSARSPVRNAVRRAASHRESLAFGDCGQFMSYAARAMRGLIVDYLRSRHAQKRGGEFEITSLPTELPHAAQEDRQSLEIEKLNEALESLAKIDARLAECVDLKFFCGFSFNEIAQLRDVSERTVQRDWDKARLLLNRFINDQEDQWQSA